MTLSAFASKKLESSARRFAAKLRHATTHPDDAEAIHQLRVSIRRYTQCLRLFRDLFREKDVKRTRKSLGHLMDVCANVRNYDIAQMVLRAADVRATHPVYERMRTVRSEAQKELVRELSKRRSKSPEARQSFRSVNRRGRLKSWTPGKSVAKNASCVLPDRCQKFFRSGEEAYASKDDLEALHHFRLDTKRFRYTLEIFREVYGVGMNRRLKELRQLQDHLGAINDCVTTASLLPQDHTLQRKVGKLLSLREKEFSAFWGEQFASDQKLSSWADWLSKPKKAS